MTHTRLYRRDSNLALLHHRESELRAARRPIPVSSSIVDEAYDEICEREAFAILRIETRDGAPHLTDEEMTQVCEDEEFRDACEEARLHLEITCAKES